LKTNRRYLYHDSCMTTTTATRSTPLPSDRGKYKIKRYCNTTVRAHYTCRTPWEIQCLVIGYGVIKTVFLFMGAKHEWIYYLQILSHNFCCFSQVHKNVFFISNRWIAVFHCWKCSKLNMCTYIFSLMSIWYHSCDNFLISHYVLLRHAIRRIKSTKTGMGWEICDKKNLPRFVMWYDFYPTRCVWVFFYPLAKARG
jgi:hypothetical protein